MKVVYWKLTGQGRLEFIRYLLHHAGVEYTLEKIADDQKDEIFAWYTKQKKELGSTKNPIINLPYIVTDEGEHVTETVAIAMFLGEKLGYYGSDFKEKTRINQLLMRLVDFRSDIRDNVMLSPKDSEKKLKFANFGLSAYLSQFENCFKIWNCKFLCSENISISDIMLFQIMDLVMHWKPSMLESFENLARWYEVMLSDEKINEHREKLKNVPFTEHYVDWVTGSNDEIKKLPIYGVFKGYLEKNPQFWGTVKTGLEAEF